MYSNRRLQEAHFAWTKRIQPNVLGRFYSLDLDDKLDPSPPQKLGD